jgi:hypothetical protein
MLKDAFGTLKSASTSLSKEPDKISSFLTFVGNKMTRYNDHTKNMVQQAICEVIFRADNGYYEQSPTKFNEYSKSVGDIRVKFFICPIIS